jgi:chlorite dismutase
MTAPTSTPRLFTFAAGAQGPWQIDGIRCVVGEFMPAASRLAIITGTEAVTGDATWTLHGITSNERYVQRDEKVALVSRQEGLGRPASLCAALIPIRKTPAWWTLTQQDRREIFEEQSRHIAIGLKYLPAVARRLHHCRDLGLSEPFDFLTWFEYAPSETSAFEDLLQALRESAEWRFVDRECDVRVSRPLV